MRGLPEGAVFSDDGKYLYVGNFLDSDMSILRVDGDQLVDTGKRLTLPGPSGVDARDGRARRETRQTGRPAVATNRRDARGVASHRVSFRGGVRGRRGCRSLALRCRVRPPGRTAAPGLRRRRIRARRPRRSPARCSSSRSSAATEVTAGAPLFALERENETAARRAGRAAAAQRRGAAREPADRQAAARGRDGRRAAAAGAGRARSVGGQPQAPAEALRRAASSAAPRSTMRERRSSATKRTWPSCEASVADAKLPARTDEIRAAEADARAAREALAQTDWRLAQRAIAAPAAGLVHDTYYVVGDWVPAGSPVVSLLPPANVKVRFFVPEPVLGRLKPGQQVTLACDGCGAPIAATIDFISDAPSSRRRCSTRRRTARSSSSWSRRRPAPADAAQAQSRPAGRRDAAAAPHERCRAAPSANWSPRGSAAARPMWPKRGGPRDVVIDVRGLNKHFGTNHVVRDLSLSVRRGEIFGFLGPNGSGKTTSIRMLCGLLTPDSGEGTCLGYDIRRESDAIKRHVGYMTQRFSFWEDLTIRENLRFRRAHVRDARAARGASTRRSSELGLTDRARPARRHALRRLEAAARARRVPAARAAAAAARRADRGRRSEGAPRFLGGAARARRARASRCSSARTTWTRPSAATSSPTSSTGSCWRRARPPR